MLGRRPRHLAVPGRSLTRKEKMRERGLRLRACAWIPPLPENRMGRMVADLGGDGGLVRQDETKRRGRGGMAELHRLRSGQVQLRSPSTLAGARPNGRL